MARNGEATRERLLDVAHALVMEQGFAATSVDAVLERASATKGAFFHHFPSKARLAHALVERYARADAEHLERVAARSERLATDPVQRLLLFVGLLGEHADESGDVPGCLFASFLYERELVQPEARELIAESMLLWRRRVAAMIEAAAEARPPRRPIDAAELADGLVVAVEGAFVLSRALDDPSLVGRQMAVYRDHLELLFSS